jgi:hypothetical protein
MPLGLHVGTNRVSAVSFSDGPWGAQWLVPDHPPADPHPLRTVGLNFVWRLAFRALVTWSLNRFYRQAR